MARYIDQEYLHSNWPLHPEECFNHKDPNSSGRGFCSHSSIEEWSSNHSGKSFAEERIMPSQCIAIHMLVHAGGRKLSSSPISRRSILGSSGLIETLKVPGVSISQSSFLFQNILWVLDVGIVNTLEQPVCRCSPKVMAIDVKSQKVVKVLDLSNLVLAESKLQYLTVDYDGAGGIFV